MTEEYAAKLKELNEAIQGVIETDRGCMFEMGSDRYTLSGTDSRRIQIRMQEDGFHYYYSEPHTDNWSCLRGAYWFPKNVYPVDAFPVEWEISTGEKYPYGTRNIYSFKTIVIKPLNTYKGFFMIKVYYNKKEMDMRLN